MKERKKKMIKRDLRQEIQASIDLIKTFDKADMIEINIEKEIIYDSAKNIIKILQKKLRKLDE